MTATVKEVTPDVAIKQVEELAEALGYQIGVVAILPRTGTMVPALEYIPDGALLKLVMIRKPTNGHNSLLSEKD